MLSTSTSWEMPKLDGGVYPDACDTASAAGGRVYLIVVASCGNYQPFAADLIDPGGSPVKGDSVPNRLTKFAPGVEIQIRPADHIKSAGRHIATPGATPVESAIAHCRTLRGDLRRLREWGRSTLR
jgi:hypothetical protein